MMSGVVSLGGGLSSTGRYRSCRSSSWRLREAATRRHPAAAQSCDGFRVKMVPTLVLCACVSCEKRKAGKSDVSGCGSGNGSGQRRRCRKVPYSA